MTNIKKLRNDFPVFHGKPEWAYLDTAATAQVPQVVMDAMSEYHCAYRASVHRGLYKEAVRVTEAYENARAVMARFLHASSSEEIIFTSGATGASNMLAHMLEYNLNLTPGEEIVTSVTEHHATLIPLQAFAKRTRLDLSFVPVKRSYALDYEVAKELITDQTRIVSIMLASNVLGTIHNVRKIARYAHEHGALVLCDATSAIGHMPVDVSKLGVDFLYFSGHKMCGPTGIGVLYGRRELLTDMEPGRYGGGIVEDVTRDGSTWTVSPLRFEAGTPNIAGVIGMAAAAEYLTRHDLGHIRTYIEALTTHAHNALKEVDGVQLVSARPERNVGIISFVVEGIHPHDVAEVAARNDIALRAGHHCALLLHKELGLNATVRASVYLYNTKQDIDRLVASVKEAKKIFRVE